MIWNVIHAGSVKQFLLVKLLISAKTNATLHTNMTNDKLTEKQHWDAYWSEFNLPVEVQKSNTNLLVNEELNIFEKYFPKKPLSILEIGGAPGQYLAYMHKQFGYKISCLDYSEVGCKKTIENFKLLNIPVNVYQQDIFSNLTNLPKFDIVYSMGLIEHFEDVSKVIEKHLDLLQPGGLLMLGLPNFKGVNGAFLKRLAPVLISQHNLKTMDIRTWTTFEKKFNLQQVFKGYIGGFEPMTFLIKEKNTFFNRILFLKARVLNRIFHAHFKFLRKYNSRYFSSYIIGIYRKL